MKQKAEKKRLKKKVTGGQEEWEPRGIWGLEGGKLCEQERTQDGQLGWWGGGVAGMGLGDWRVSGRPI